MCIGIALDVELLTSEFITRFSLQQRVRQDLFGSPAEIHFQYNDPIPQLPIVQPEQQNWELVTWGNRNQANCKLPRTGWTREESLLAGKWNYLHPTLVQIPAQRGHEKQVWFPIQTQAITGVLVADEQGEPHVFMLTRAATPEYQYLTKHDRMPVWADWKPRE